MLTQQIFVIWHIIKKRWLNGSITAAIAYPFDKKLWFNAQDIIQKNISYFFRQQWGSNKENIAKSKEKNQFYGHSRWPSLIIIPDISNNEMILSEITKVGLPVIGLVNSQCHFEIDYPIFAQDQSFSSVHFFCHFLATLIAKEMVYSEHKRYITQRAYVKKKINLVSKKQQILLKKKNAFSNSFSTAEN